MTRTNFCPSTSVCVLLLLSEWTTRTPITSEAELKEKIYKESRKCFNKAIEYEKNMDESIRPWAYITLGRIDQVSWKTIYLYMYIC